MILLSRGKRAGYKEQVDMVSLMYEYMCIEKIWKPIHCRASSFSGSVGIMNGCNFLPFAQ